MESLDVFPAPHDWEIFPYLAMTSVDTNQSDDIQDDPAEVDARFKNYFDEDE